MKNFLSGLFYFTLKGIMLIPFNLVRFAFLKPILGHLGNDVFVARSVDIRKPQNIEIGSNTAINKLSLLDGRGGYLKIGNCVDIAQEAQIWTLQHDYNSPCYAAVGKPVSIGDYAWIGTRAIILPGVNVGEGAVVAAGAVVTKDIEPYTVVAGVPAKKITERQRSLSYKLGKWRWFQ